MPMATTDKWSPRPLTWVLDFFSSVWVGVFWLALLFVYCSIGSAVPQVRQHYLLEMTEFQWFHWWPFNVLMGLFATSLIVVTLRRIPLRAANAGVWMIHAGIIILCVGSYYYFGTKVEGDTPVFRRHVRIELPDLAEPRQLIALPGAHTSVAVGSHEWHFEVQRTNPAWPILSEEHVGEEAYAVHVQVTPPTGSPFVRLLLAGFPQYTEDIIPGQGRAIKSTGKKLLDEDLELSLEPEPQEYFNVMQTWALYVRRPGETKWSQRPIKNLPRYNDRIGSRDQVFIDPGFPVPLRSLDVDVPPPAAGDALSNASVRITGYLRYARMERRWKDGGDRLNPVVKIRVPADPASGRSYELVALDPVRREIEGGLARLIWLDDPADIASLPTDSRAMLHFEVPERDDSFIVQLTRETVVGHEGEFTPIKGTELAYRVLNVQDNLVLPGSGQTVSVAMVEINAPEGVFTRMVADQAHMTRDMRGVGRDPHAPDARRATEVDPRIRVTYQPQSPPIIFAAHPDGLYFVYNGSSGGSIRRAVGPGDTVEVLPGLRIGIDSVITHAVAQRRPAIVPRPARRRNVGESLAMIRLEINTGRGAVTQWVPYNDYVFPNGQYAYGGRFAYSPRTFRMDDGSLVEVLFSRERRKLPAPVTLEDFELDTYVGGYSGQVSTIRNYVSRLRFRDRGLWTAPAKISVNAPTQYAGYWFFQSMWDKPQPSDPSGGMNYTGLGVGNRNGVYLQLLGCCLAVTGMTFAFYVKPVLQRRHRRRRQSLANVSRADEECDAALATRPVTQPVEA